jgi:hypothetical protein
MKKLSGKKRFLQSHWIFICWNAKSYSGNSGLPVIFNLLRQQSTIYLAGILKGSFHRKEPDIIMDAYLKQNVGIAAVIPNTSFNV